MKSKTIILSTDERANKSGRGILTLYSEDNLLKCRLRLYNINYINKFCKLGIYHNSQVYSANLLEKNGVYESSFVGDFDIDQDFFTAIVDTSNSNKVIISGGTYAGHFYNNDTAFDSINLNQQAGIAKNIDTSQPITDLIEPICNQDEISSSICNSCQNCIYKDYFYSHHKQEPKQTEQPTPTSNSKTIANEIDTTNFINSLLPQFEYIFENYPEDEDLIKKIAHSKFVKINEHNEQYSIGAIFENNTIKYLCYAVKRNYNQPIPEELGNNYQWLPLDEEDPLSDGYYLVFQDAQDLKIIEL